MTAQNAGSLIACLGLLVLIMVVSAGCVTPFEEGFTGLDGHHNATYTIQKIQHNPDGCGCTILTTSGEALYVWGSKDCIFLEENRTYQFIQWDRTVCDLSDPIKIGGIP